MIRQGITGVGNWVIDHIKIINAWPEEGHLANILEEKLGTGGLPTNVLTDLAKFQTGLPLKGIGLVGKDSDGDYIISHCKSHNINIQGLIRTDKEPTSYTDVMTVKGSGRRTFFHNRGANKLLTEDLIPWEQLDTTKLFHLGYILLLDGLDQPDSEFGTKAAKVLHKAKKLGLKTSIDVVSEMSDRFKKLVPPTLPYVDYLILNELEAGHTTGHQIRKGETIDAKALKESAHQLIRMGVNELVVIHFPEGGYALTQSGKEKIVGSLQLPEGYIQGTVGAGDAFCAGMLYGIHENWNLEKSLELAIASAAACLASPTSSDSMLPLHQTLQLLEKYPSRKDFKL